MEKKKHILGRVQITRQCNQNCVFCSVPSDKESLSLQQIQNYIRELKAMGTTEIMITGGEPMMNNNIMEILHFCESLEFEDITLQTNGTLLEDRIEELKEIRNLRINVSFHTCDKMIYGKLSGEPDNFDKVINSLEKLKKTNIQVLPTIVVNSLNVGHLKQHILFISEHFPNIRHISFNFIDPTGNADDNSWIVPKLSDSEVFIEEIVEIMKLRGITFRIEKMPLCYMRGFEEFSSDARRNATGDYRIMRFLRTLKDTEKHEIDIESKTHFSYHDACNHCNLKYICPGINHKYAQLHGTKELYPVFESPESVIQKITKDRASEIANLEYDLNKSIASDLSLFDFAIRSKSNFNSIYDTYSFFMVNPPRIENESFIKNMWINHVNEIKVGKSPDLLSYYIHFPFCQSNCRYCVYPSTVLNSNSDIPAYLKYIKKKMHEYSDIFGGLKFRTLYIGGGTPSLMTESQLKGFLSYLFNNFEFDEDGEKAIEFNPSSTTKKKLEIINNFGFNKLSIGVQSVSNNVLESNFRGYQKLDQIERVIKWFKELKMSYLNVDLILGLFSDTPERFAKSFESICRISPNNICIYPIKTNDQYIEKNYGSKKEFERFYYPLFDQSIKNMRDISNNYGYIPISNMDNASYIAPIVFSNLKMRVKPYKYTYGHFRKQLYSIFSLGFYSHGRISGKMDYRFIDRNINDSIFLKGFSANPNDYIFSITSLDKDFDKVKFIVMDFYRKRKLQRKEYKEFFGTDIVMDFQYAISLLKKFGIIKECNEDFIEFSDIDEREAYKYLLFFVGRQRVKERMNIC